MMKMCRDLCAENTFSQPGYTFLMAKHCFGKYNAKLNMPFTFTAHEYNVDTMYLLM
jgi:hypothetical protein